MTPLIEAAPVEVITPPPQADLANSIEVRSVYKSVFMKPLAWVQAV